MSTWTEAKVIHLQRWTERLVSLRLSADIDGFKAGQFVRVAMDIDGERVGRPYSFVNAPHEEHIEIYFNIIPDGPLTPRLAALQEGDCLWVHRAANGFMTLDEVPERRHLWLLATGTAIGPFLSILKTTEAWQRFDTLVLAHAVRTRDELTYQEAIARLRCNYPERFHYIPFVSREPAPGALSGRIPASIADGRLERQAGLELRAEHSHVMLCGNSGMIEDAVKVLGERGLRRHLRRTPGHITTEKYH